MFSLVEVDLGFGFETINDLAQSAGNIGGAVTTSLGAVRSLIDLVKSPKDASEAQIKAALENIAATIEKAQVEARLLKTQALLLEHELQRVEAAQAQLERYELHRTPAGGTVYALKDPDSSPDGGHFLCTNCYTDGRPSILQGGPYVMACPRCGAKFNIEKPQTTSFIPVY